MFCPEELKHNKLIQVAIPKPRDMFGNFGLHDSSDSAYSGAYVASSPLSKVEELARIQKYENKRLKKDDSED